MKQKITVTLSTDLVKAIDKMSDEERRSRSNMMEILLEEAFENFEKPKDKFT